MPSEMLLVLYCILIVVASMAGGWLPMLMRMTHLRTQLLMSFVAGLMLGIAMLHLLPHATDALGSASKAGAAALGGVIAMFLLMRLFHAHDHNVAIAPDDAIATDVESHRLTKNTASSTRHGEHRNERQHGHDHTHSHQHDHAHDHHHHHSDGVHAHAKPAKNVGWAGMMFGLGLHTLVDGIALAASVVTDAQHGSWLGLAGLGTFLAVALHKPLDAFAISSVMQKGGWSASGRSFANFLFSLACPIGAALFYLSASMVIGSSELLGWGLAISAGFFICISLSDLLPEVAFHDHDRIKLTSSLLVGVVLAIAIESLPGHNHEHPLAKPSVSAPSQTSD